MTPLRRRMTEDMMMRNFSPYTQRNYLFAVARFARHFNASPADLGPEDLRAWFIFGHFWVTDGRAEAAGPLRVRPDLRGCFCHGGGQPPRLRRAGSAAVRGPAG